MNFKRFSCQSSSTIARGRVHTYVCMIKHIKFKTKFLVTSNINLIRFTKFVFFPTVVCGTDLDYTISLTNLTSPAQGYSSPKGISKNYYSCLSTCWWLHPPHTFYLLMDSSSDSPWREHNHGISCCSFLTLQYLKSLLFGDYLLCASPQVS